MLSRLMLPNFLPGTWYQLRDDGRVHYAGPFAPTNYILPTYKVGTDGTHTRMYA